MTTLVYSITHEGVPMTYITVTKHPWFCR